MNNLFKLKSTIYFIKNLVWWFFLFLLGFVLGFVSDSVNAVELTTIDLNFSQIENPWNLTETITLELDSYNTNHDYLHIAISGTELHVYSYDNLCSLTDDTITCDYQAVYRTKYTYDSTNSAFSKSKSDMYYSATTYDINNVVYSSYEFVEPFPNVDSFYDPLYEILKEDTPRSNLEYLIQEFEDKINVPFAIFYNSGFGINILYTPDGTAIIGDGDGISGGGFNYKAENGSLYQTGKFLHFESMTTEDVDTWISEIKTNIDSDNITTNGSFGSYAPDTKNWPLVYYSEADEIQIIDNTYDGPIIWQDEEYVNVVPSIYEKIKNMKYIFDDTVDLTSDNPPKKLILHLDLSLTKEFYVTYDYACHHGYINAPYILYDISDTDDVVKKNYPLDNYCTSGEDCYGQYRGWLGVDFSVYTKTTADIVVDIPDPSIIPEIRKQMRIYFELSVPFTYEYIYENNVSDLNFTGNYAVAFIPKMKNFCEDTSISEIYTAFYLTLNKTDLENTAPFQIARYNTTNSNFEIVDEPLVLVPIETENGTTFKYDYVFQRQELNDILIVRNALYSENLLASIKYDSSLFEYQILQTEESIISFTNPNTCEDIIGFLPSKLNEDYSLDGFLSNLSEMMNKSNSVLSLFNVFFVKIFNSDFRTVLILSITIFIIILIISWLRRD